MKKTIILDTICSILFFTFIVFSPAFAGENQTVNSAQPNSPHKHLLEQDLDNLIKQLENIDQQFKTAVIITNLRKERDVVYIAPMDEVKNNSRLFLPKYRTTINDLKVRIREIGEQGKMKYLYTVLLLINKTTFYKDLYAIISAYETQVYSLYPQNGEVIFYRFGVPNGEK